MFELDFFKVGNYSAIGFMEENQEMAVREMINDIKINYSRPVSKNLVDRKMLEYGIDYDDLTYELRQLIDKEIDVKID